jgi:hypothetical protein
MGTMIVLAIAGLATLALISLGGAILVNSLLRRRKRADPLPKDWWPHFEEAFRDYAMGSSQRPRETEQ